MDTTWIQWLFDAIIFLIAGLGGWILKSITSALKDLQVADIVLADKVQAIEVLVAGQYIKRTEIDAIARQLFDKLDNIRDMIDKKADRA